MDVLVLMSILRLYPGLKLSFEHNSFRKNLFLSPCFRWESRLPLRKMDQKFNFGGTIGYGDSYLGFLFRNFQVFRLHAILHDAAGAVRSHIGKGPGNCYMLGRGLNSCLFGHFTALLPLSRTLSAFHFLLCRLLKQYVLHCTRFRAWR